MLYRQRFRSPPLPPILCIGSWPVFPASRDRLRLGRAILTGMSLSSQSTTQAAPGSEDRQLSPRMVCMQLVALSKLHLAPKKGSRRTKLRTRKDKCNMRAISAACQRTRPKHGGASGKRSTLSVE